MKKLLAIILVPATFGAIMVAWKLIVWAIETFAH